MGNKADDQRRRKSGRFLFGSVVLGVGAVAIAAIVVISLLMPGPTPEEVARRWADDNVDWVGEEVAGFILNAVGQEGLNAVILKELGGEWIEDRIHEHLLWSFSPATADGSGGHVVVATASVDFEVVELPVNGRVGAAAPFRLVIEGDNVLNAEIMFAQASVDARLGGAGIGTGQVTEEVKGFLGK